MSNHSSSTLTYRVAAIQFEPTLGEKEKNVHHLLRLVEQAAQHGARLIVLPEMATTGYCWASRQEIAPFVETIPGQTTERFQVLASRYGCYIALSLPEIDPSTNAYYNSAALLGPHGLVGSYRKLHSYISEPRWARDGDLGIPVWETELGRLSALICMDANYFEAARLAALHQADVVLFPVNWDNEKCPNSWWMARAFENGLYIIAANRYGRERGVQFGGGSCIINPDGTLQTYVDNGEAIVLGEVNLALSRDKRWGSEKELIGDRLADRLPEEYTSLVQNTYLWEPLRYHGLYELGELPPGQLSCAGIVQMSLETSHPPHQGTLKGRLTDIQDQLRTLMRDAAPALPDVLVLPELLLPGPPPATQEQISDTALIAHYQQGAITIPGPETAALVALAEELQISIVLGVAERVEQIYYNTVLLIDPEGIYGIYRKLHLTVRDQLWTTRGNLGLPTFDTPAGRIGLVTGYDVLFPETLRVLAGQGADLICAPTLLNFPEPAGLPPTSVPHIVATGPDEFDPLHYLIWRVRAAEHNVYLALANWSGQQSGIAANGLSGVFSPSSGSYPWLEVVADEDETGLMLMTIDTREQRTGRRTTRMLEYSPGDMVGSLTGELAYNILDTIPGNVVRSKPLLRKRLPFWYLDLVRKNSNSNSNS
jgi:predicted amidohydrolase